MTLVEVTLIFVTLFERLPSTKCVKVYPKKRKTQVELGDLVLMNLFSLVC